jgi:hypothetical protein
MQYNTDNSALFYPSSRTMQKKGIEKIEQKVSQGNEK